MVDITFSVNGRRVSPDDVADTLEGMLQVAAMESLAEHAREQLGELRCAEHHEAARVIGAGPSLEELTLSVQGCCQALVDEAMAMLQDHEQGADEVQQPRRATPRVFVSHASEDKDRFVLEFARRLREKGVDAWVDRWEMLPGDSIVDKIFEEGIKNADAIIVVVSRYSVDKRWVREELNAGFVQKIERGSKLIAVIIDDVEVPEVLKPTLWQKIANLESYDAEFNRLLLAIFGTSDKPALGTPPSYVSTPIDALPGLTRVDTLVMKAICEAAIEVGHPMVMPEQVRTRLEGTGIEEDTFEESVDILANHYYIEVSYTAVGISHMNVTTHGFGNYARTFIPGFDQLVTDVGYTLLNTNVRDLSEIAEALNQPEYVVEHILDEMNSKNYIKLSKHIGGAIVWQVNPGLRRAWARK